MGQRQCIQIQGELEEKKIHSGITKFTLWNSSVVLTAS